MEGRKPLFRRVGRQHSPEGGPPSAQMPPPGRHPLIGWMKGTLTIAPGVDLTEPAEPEWGEVAYGNRTWDEQKLG